MGRNIKFAFEKDCCFYILFKKIFNVYLRDRDRAPVGEGQREREAQNPKQSPGSELSAQSRTWDSNPQTVRSRPELKSDAYPTEPPRRPLHALSVMSGLERNRHLPGTPWKTPGGIWVRDGDSLKQSSSNEKEE